MSDPDTAPHTHELHVKGMSCQHCVKAMTKAIQAQDPQAAVVIELPQGLVKVQTLLSREATSTAISNEGYEILA
jgi:copper chaperone